MALLSMAAVSCSVEKEAPEQAPAGRNLVTLGATVDQTKAAISNDAVFSWQANDVLSVVVGKKLVDFSLIEGAGSKTAVFGTLLEAGETVGSTAIYPAGAHQVAGESVTINLPSSYVFEEDNTNIPMVGAVADGKIKFVAVGGVARFVAGIPEGAAKVVLVTDKKITGDFAVEEGVIAAGEGEDEVAYTFGPLAADKNLTFNFPLPVGEYTMTFKVLDANGEPIAELAGSAAHEIKAADVLVFDELEFPANVGFSLTKVWGRYSATDAGWWDKMAGLTGDMYRCATMDDNYVYLPKQVGGSEAVIYYFPIDDPEDIQTLPATTVTNGGTHIVACARIAPSASGSKLLVGNLTVGNSLFEVWKWDDVQSEPTKVLSYSAPDGCRLGDKFDFYGTWEDGEILALNGYASGRAWIFKVKDGVVDPEPVKTDYLGGTANNFGSLYRWFDSNEYLKIGHQPADPAMIYTRSGDEMTLEGTVEFEYDGNLAGMLSTENYPIKNVAHGFRTFEINGKAYAAFVGNYDWNYETVLRVYEVDKTQSMLSTLQSLTPKKGLSFSLSNADGALGIRAPYTAGNGSADLTVRKIKGVTYLLAHGPNIGTALYKMDEVEAEEPEPEVPLVTRVWGKYHKDGNWFSDLGESLRKDWMRNGTMSGSFIYIPVVNEKKVAVYDLAGNHVSTIEGFAGGGTFTVNSIAALGDAVYVSSTGGNVDWISGALTIYKLTGKDSEGKFTSFELAAEYTDFLTDTRYGDKMTAYGSDADGVLIFVDYHAYNASAQCRSNLQFHVENGVVNPVPYQASYLVTGEGKPMAGIYILDGGPGKSQFALYASNVADTRAISLDTWLNNTGGGWWNYGPLPSGDYGRIPAITTNCLDPKVFTADGKDYLAYVVVPSSGDAGTVAYLNVVEIPAGGNILSRIDQIDMSAAMRFGLTDPDDPDAASGAGNKSNSTGFCELSVVDGQLYLLAGADCAGMSLFKINVPAPASTGLGGGIEPGNPHQYDNFWN